MVTCKCRRPTRVHSRPSPFLIFINDIVEDIQAQIKLFADDTSLYIMVDNPTETAKILNDDLDKIYNW